MTCFNVRKLENLNNLVHQNFGIEMIIHGLQTLLQLRVFEVDFDGNLAFTDPISSPLVDTGIRNSFSADNIKRQA